MDTCMLALAWSGMQSLLVFGCLGVLSALKNSTSHEYGGPGAKGGVVSGGNL